VNISTQSTFEDIFWFNFHAFGAFANLMANLCAVVAYIVLWVTLGQLFEQFFSSYKIFFHKYLWVIVRAFSAFFAKSVHVVPTEFANNVLEFTSFSMKAKSHIKVGTTFVNMSKRTMLSFITFLSHKIWANF